MTFLKKHFFNLIFVCLFSIVLIKQAPLYLNSYKKKGTKLLNIKVIDLKNNLLKLPVENKRAVYIFWATWCSPCHMQLKLFKNAVLNEKIKSEDIIAINLGEDLIKVRNFENEKKYPFKIVIAISRDSWKEIGIVATPSIAYVDEFQTIKKFSAGMSPLAVYKSQSFLK